MDVSSNKHLIHVGPSNKLDTLASQELVQLGLNLRKCSHKDRALSYVPSQPIGMFTAGFPATGKPTGLHLALDHCSDLLSAIPVKETQPGGSGPP
jgi:hypothetical protein